MTNAQGIDVWLVDYAFLNDTALHAAYRKVLSEEERLQEKRFHFERDQRRYLVTRALVRLTLSRYAGIAPENLRFTANRHGRPEIANPEVQARHLSFNVSHTHSLIVLAVTSRRHLGVDVENIAARKGPLELASRFFAPQEVASIRALPAHEQSHRFFEYWTLKESYLKARGMGLSTPLDRFAIRLTDRGEVTIDARPDFDHDVDRWQFWQFVYDEHYLIAICAERGRSEVTPSVTVRRTVPLVEARVVDDVSFLRAPAADHRSQASM